MNLRSFIKGISQSISSNLRTAVSLEVTKSWRIILLGFRVNFTFTNEISHGIFICNATKNYTVRGPAMTYKIGV